MEPIVTPDVVAPPKERVHVRSYLDGSGGERALADDVLDGLTRPFKELPPKHFYDAHGAQLFDRICELPEYYPTRTERAILEAQSDAIVEATGATELVELGSGTAAKTRVLLDAMERAGTLSRYVPFDVTESMVLAVADELTAEYDGLQVRGIVGDFERHLDRVPPTAPDGSRIVAFLGGPLRALRGEPTGAQEAPDMIGMVRDVEPVADEVGDPRAGPQRGAEPEGLRPLENPADQRGALPGGQLGRAAWDGACPHPGTTLPAVRPLPAAHRPAIHPQALGQQRPGPHEIRRRGHLRSRVGDHLRNLFYSNPPR
jgi:hypothetical protein